MRQTIYNWLHRSWRMAFLLLIFNFQFSILNSSFAQTQDALYIFRNDGKFNFFFFGEITGFDYSRIDTLGVEQEDYVVQEIYTADTCYRIPLSAIDSVSFVTPETKLKSDVKVRNDLFSNIIASDQDWYIILSQSVPQQSVPKVGDKIYIDGVIVENGVEHIQARIPNGFAGKVIVSEYLQEPVDGNYGWLVVTEPTSLTDIYEQVVVKEAANTTGNVYTKEHFAEGMEANGLDGITVDVPERDIQVPYFSRYLTLSNSVISTPDEAPVSISADLTGSINLNLIPKLKYRACLFLSPFTGFHFDQRSVWDIEKNIFASLSGTLNSRFEVGFGKSKKVEIGKFQIDLGAGLFMEASMTGFQFDLIKQTQTRTTNFMAMSSNNIEQTAVGGIVLDPQVNSHTDVLKDTVMVSTQMNQLTYGLLLPEQMSFGMGVYAKAETKLSLPLEKSTPMPEFIKKYLSNYASDGKVNFKAALGFDIGAKVEVKCPWKSLFGNDSDLDEGKIDLLIEKYKDLRDNGSVKPIAYAKATAELSLGKWKLGDTWEISRQSVPRYFVPDIKGLDVKLNSDEKPEKPYMYRFTSGIDRKMFINTNVGFVVLDEDRNVVDNQNNLPWYGPEMFEKGIAYYQNGTYYNNFAIDPGKGKPVKYTVYPIVWIPFAHNEVVVDCPRTFTREAARFDIGQRIVRLGERGGYVRGEYVGFYEVNVVPNMRVVDASTTADWITNVNWQPDECMVSFHWDDLPEGMRERRAVIHFDGWNFRGSEVLAEDSIVVIQSRAYIILEPEKLTFPKEGGTKTVTIKETNLTDLKLKIPASSPEIHGTLSGNKVIITMDENKNPGKRGNMVRIEGKSIDGEIVYGGFDVEQEGTGEDPGPHTDGVYNIEIGHLGGHYDFVVPENSCTNRKAKANNNAVYAELEQYNWMFDGKEYLYLWIDPNRLSTKKNMTATVTGTDASGATVTLLTVNITQKASTNKYEVKIIDFSLQARAVARSSEDGSARIPGLSAFANYDPERIKMVREGNVMHVSGQYTDVTKDGITTKDIQYSFNIPNWDKVEEGNVVVTNLKISNNTSSIYGDNNEKSELEVARVEANGISLYDANYDEGWELDHADGVYKDDNNSYWEDDRYERNMRIKGDESSGLTFSDWFFSWKYDVSGSDSPGNHRYIEYSLDRPTEVQVTLKLVKDFIYDE
ncbi:MAG: BACON domain-containing protein [Bacteroidaceae bacterium]|nr:BACON domain-containing protein [Bacteroidaceae bacterium]